MMERMFDQPLIAVDVVPVRFTEADWVEVGTVARVNAPYQGEQALPGVLLGPNEMLQAAAYRALKAKADVDQQGVRHLMQLGAFDRPDRDPRSHALSIAFLAVVEPGAGAGDGFGSGIQWETVDDTYSDLPFFHGDIISEAVSAMRARLWSDLPLTRALTGERFPTTTASAIAEQLTGAKPRPSTLHRDLTVHPNLERIARASSSHAGRPAVLWEWVD